jgi:hypothetical protein
MLTLVVRWLFQLFFGASLLLGLKADVIGDVVLVLDVDAAPIAKKGFIKTLKTYCSSKKYVQLKSECS